MDQRLLMIVRRSVFFRRVVILYFFEQLFNEFTAHLRFKLHTTDAQVSLLKLVFETLQLGFLSRVSTIGFFLENRLFLTLLAGK